MLLRIFAMLILMVAAPCGLPAEERRGLRAFVVGINEYPAFDASAQLRSAVKDAEDIATDLRALGFTVDGPFPNAELATLLDGWRKFLDKLQPGDVAVVYFSGHGFEAAGENYLLPKDLPALPTDKKARRDMLSRRAIALSQWIVGDSQSGSDEADGIAKLSQRFFDEKKDGVHAVFIIDACRVRPDKGTKMIPMEGAGLTPPPVPGGTFILYAAEAGKPALDTLGPQDKDANSVFTRELRIYLKPENAKKYSLTSIAEVLKQQVYAKAQTRMDDNGNPIPSDQTPAFYHGFRKPRTLLGDERNPLEVAVTAAAEQRPEQKNLAIAANFSATKSLLEAGSRLQGWLDPSCPDCPPLTLIPEAPEKGIKHRFGIGKTEVTVGQWSKCVRDKVCMHNDHGYDDRTEARDDRPMRYVSWKDANDFIRWLNTRPGSSAGKPLYRLPSELEWEYAASAGSNEPYAFGTLDGKADPLCKYANGADASTVTWMYRGYECKDGYGDEPAPVARFAANDFGLFDMHGNVWEWVSDCYSEKPASSQKADALSLCNWRVARGGSWRSLAAALTSKARNAFPEGHRRSTVGFRIARDFPV